VLNNLLDYLLQRAYIFPKLQKYPQSPHTSGLFAFLASQSVRCAMAEYGKPTKEKVRQYMEKRRTKHEPLPDSVEEYRRKIGWHMLPNNRKKSG
jgi:hypothetical protein